MTLINISLCLPELDIVALRQKRSIVVVTQRFIVPDRSFALLPCRSLAAPSQLSDLYHQKVLAELQSAALPTTEPMKATHWAQCVFCQQVSEDAIATLSELTIWTKQSLSDQLREDRLFLSFLRTYALPKHFLVESEPICDQLYKFLPLPNYIEVDEKSPSYSGDEFAAAKKAILEPESSEPSALPEGKPIKEAEPIEKAEPPSKSENILESEDWVTKISEIGNSSDGHTFEKLVRKGLITLGFSNSLNNPKVSLDPAATGGAGGLDFYADKPYSIVGECKATARGSVGDPATQLHKLGLKYLLKEEFGRSVKLILAAGRITDDSNQIAIGHEMNVIRPESLQVLVALKLEYGTSFRLSDLKTRLQRPPFGTDADAKISSLVQQWEIEFKAESERLQRGRQIVQTVKELSEQPIHKEREDFFVAEIRAHHNAKYQPCITDKATKDTLTELSSPYSAGYLGKKRISGDQEYFYFKKDMPQTDS